jgi:hypothetical protein
MRDNHLFGVQFSSKFSNTDFSKEIKQFRYKKYFFKNHIFPIYPQLSLISEKFNFDTKALLELLFENLYDEGKNDLLVYQMNRFKEKARFFVSLDLALLVPVVFQYMQSINIHYDKKKDVIEYLKRLSVSFLIITSMFSSIWKLSFFYIQEPGRVKFYSKRHIDEKFAKILKKIGYSNNEVSPIFAEFVTHMTSGLFLGKKKEIEETFSRYYTVYCKKMSS